MTAARRGGGPKVIQLDHQRRGRRKQGFIHTVNSKTQKAEKRREKRMRHKHVALASSFALCPRYKSDPGEHIWPRGVLALAKRQSHNST